MAMGEPGPDDALIDASSFPPEIIAGRCQLDLQAQREAHMSSILREALQQSDIVLAVVGYMHAGVLARQFEKEQIPVELFQMTLGLVLNESQT